MSKSYDNLIHVAKIDGSKLLFLKQVSDDLYQWFLDDKPENITAPTIEEAIFKGKRAWKTQGFTPLKCGFCYTLPERDEHGMNAYFYQMANSYKSSNGVFFDPRLGHSCLVQMASKEALGLLKDLS